MNRKKDRMKRRDDRDQPSPAEKASMTLSVLVTVVLFGFTAYMGATAPERPDVGVQVVQTEVKDDAVHVHVEVSNHGSKGFTDVTVEVDCDEPAPSVMVRNLPASGKKAAVVVCPPGTTEPEAKLVSMIPE